jgi:hypothetical protein
MKQSLAIAHAIRSKMKKPAVVESHGHEEAEHEDRSLAMKDSYPEGEAESDTEAQDEGDGKEPLDNEEGNMDQKKDRMERVMGMIRNRHMGKRS